MRTLQQRIRDNRMGFTNDAAQNRLSEGKNGKRVGVTMSYRVQWGKLARTDARSRTRVSASCRADHMAVLPTTDGTRIRAD
jgi:hypothetical protein